LPVTKGKGFSCVVDCVGPFIRVGCAPDMGAVDGRRHVGDPVPPVLGGMWHPAWRSNSNCFQSRSEVAHNVARSVTPAGNRIGWQLSEPGSSPSAAAAQAALK